MLNVPVKFVEDTIHSYKQTCKRAANFLESLKENRYIVQKKRKWFGKDTYEVNVFGEHQLQHGSLDNILEFLLLEGKISTIDYQLLKFYDQSLDFDEVVEEILNRKTESRIIGITSLEMQLLNELSSFVEDETLTKEELLDGFNL